MIGQRIRRSRQRGEPSSPFALVTTVALHVAIVMAMVAAPQMVRPALPVYHVELVAAPRPEPEQRRAPEVVERPAERPAPVATRQPRRTSVAKTPPPPTPSTAQREPAPRTTPEAVEPKSEPSTGSDVATVKTEGVVFPYPEYLRNLVAQVYRRWDRPRGNVPLRAEVLFFVRRDGSVSNLQFVQRSGSFAFDLEAQGAIEAAANAGVFGPLPVGYPADVLPVSFFFDPSSAR